MAHSYTRSSGGVPTELQHPPHHEYSERREPPLTLPPISAAYPYPPQQGHGPYASRYDGRPPITLPSIHPHPSLHQPPPPHHYQPGGPQQGGPTQHYRGNEGYRPSNEGLRYEPYPQAERPPHLQQNQAQKYATLPSEPYVPSSHKHPYGSEGQGRALKKISQRRGERSDDDHRGAQDKNPRSLQAQPQPLQPLQPLQPPLGLYAHAPRGQVVASQQQQQHMSPQAMDQGRWPESAPLSASSHQDLQERDIRKRSASGESGKMMDPSIPPIGQVSYIEQGRLGGRPHGTAAHLPSQSPSTPSPTCTYTLTMRQQPLAARACGFGERDRRVIDPPPILQLTISDASLTPAEIQTRLKNPYYVVHCSLWSADHDVDNSAMDDPSRGDTALRASGGGSGQRRLMGTLVASPFYGKDEFDTEGCFFCFPDLSCRTTGRYRLKFNMVLLNVAAMGLGDCRPFEASVISGVVVVYAAKDFPGMSSSSKLTRRLKEQGCLISVKKGIERVGERGGKGKGREEEEDDEGPAVGAGAAGGGRGGR